MDAETFSNHPHVRRLFWFEALYDAFPCRFTLWLFGRAAAKARLLRAETVGYAIQALAKLAMRRPFRQADMGTVPFHQAYLQGAMQAGQYMNASPYQQSMLTQQMLASQQRARGGLFNGLLAASGAIYGGKSPWH